ncbi:ATP synthase F1 subunit delta [Faecalibacter bovis]|uniref:ATP synthase subunit delta n=1 Tax=Faecalibacter bovis TaxID=2898187 RepID=A0ABX7XEP3_9FLAO|nr:ATP synthase F1 subunit delta [Faecalibacter bovis]MBS7333395.1 ATP synthase F1 subunit delta [Weeksellaceae bacterium]QTV06365.1 ATP synthase F1 subunit delta [Faecalibacter bovis]
MAGFRAANRYAKGLMQYALEANQTDLVYAEMNEVINIINKSDDLKVFLNSPILDVKVKETTLAQIFASFSPTSQKFISLVVKQGRENILSKIAEQFITIYDIMNNIVTAEITSAVELDQPTIDKIVAKAKEGLDANAQVKVVNKIDASLIGGFVLKVGNTQIDSSIKSRLTSLKKEFLNKDYIPKY